MSKKNDSLIKIWCILFTGAEPCSLDATLHYSWDFAQCVHYPHHAMQVGPIYFATPRKCHVFGMCSEGTGMLLK